MSERLNRIEKIMEESSIRFDKMVLENERTRKEADIRNKEANIRTKALHKELKEIGQKLIGMGLTQGDISEEIIADNFGNVFKDVGEYISTVERNLKIYTRGVNKRVKGEFDIIGSSRTKVFVGETKTKLTKSHIDKLINITIPNFKKYDYRHDGMKVYGVIGTRIFANENVLPYAIKNGLYVIKETHKGTARILKKSLVGVKSF